MPKLFNTLPLIVQLLCVLTAVLPISASGADEDKHRWVQGSWVNLRASAATQAEVIDHLIVNTEVLILSRQGEWCEVSVKDRLVRGFMTCKLIGERPVTLAGASSNDETTGNAARAFWLAPSAQRLMAAGSYFWSKLLSERQRAREEINFDGNQTYDEKNPPKILRFAAPEFEAMKALMKNGVIAASENRPPAVKWSEIAKQLPRDDSDSVQFEGIYLYGNALSLARLVSPAPVAPSLFKRVTDLAARSVTTEQLSAQFGIVERMRVVGGPQWVFFRHDNPRVAGYWDLGSYELALEKPVVEYVIGRRGLASAKLWHTRTKHDIAADEGCTEGMGFQEQGVESLKGYPVVKDPLVWIYTPEALPYKKVAIKRYAKRISAQASGKPAWQVYQLDLIVAHEIDLDGDGIVDLAVWEGMPANAASGAEITVRFVLANIAGEWHLIEADSYTECT